MLNGNGNIFSGLLLVVFAATLSLNALGQKESAAVRWSQMSEAERQSVRENFNRWKEMPSTEKEALKRSEERFRSLSDRERALVLERYKRFKTLAPEHQQRIRTRVRTFLKLPLEERAKRLVKLRERRSALTKGVKTSPRQPSSAPTNRKAEKRRPASRRRE